jgi:digeranylgeranylglycerophospholipid reductase
MKEFDVAIVGAGTSGAVAARFAALYGLNACLIDAHKKEEIGNKMCGDGVLATIFDFLKIDPPKGDEIVGLKKQIRFYASDLQNFLTINMPLYLVNRLSFGQKLLNEAIDAGVNEFFDNSKVMDLTYNNGKVNGVTVRLASGDKTEIKAKIVIDGSGAHSILRNKIKSNVILNKISDDDLAICYREIIQFSDQNRPDLPTDSLTVVFDPDNVPGGYFWYFPKSEDVSNMGSGVFLQRRSELKPLYSNFVVNKFVPLRNFKVLSSGGDIVPVRRPLPSCADDGIMFIGDAACHVNNSSGGGIHTGMKAGYYSAMVAKNAIDAEDYTLNQLWKYNRLVMNDFGIEHAANDIARLLLQYTKTKDFDYIVKKKLMNDDDITQMYYSKSLSPSIKEMMLKLFKGILNPRLLLKLNYLLTQMKKFKKHYLNYPFNVQSFQNWRKIENDMFNKVISKIGFEHND